MVSLRINYTTRRRHHPVGTPYVIVFTVGAALDVGERLFYLFLGERRFLFGADLAKINTANLDDWLQLQTQQRYSLRGLADMAEAFADGLDSAYNGSAARILIDQAVLLARRGAFQSESAPYYARQFSVELTDPNQLPAALAYLRRHHDELRKSLGEPGYVNYLRRWRRYCQFHSPNYAAVFERLIQHANAPVTDPTLPDLPDCDARLQTQVKKQMHVNEYNIEPFDIVLRAHAMLPK